MSDDANRSTPIARLAGLTLALACALGGSGLAAAQEKTLRIAMTAGDIPRTLGQPDQGYEGNRFTGITLYDGLTQWDLSAADKPSVLIPDLAESWAVDPNDHTKWIFKLRQGVTFHDGSPFDAKAVVWNVDKVLNKAAPQYDPSQIGVTASRMPTLRSARVIDPYTVELTTAEPDSFLPYNLTNLFMASPTHWQAKFDAVPAAVTDPAQRAQQAWTAFAADASGTGPFKMAKFVPRERLELAANPAYWDPKRRPHIDHVVLLPLPEASARTAALLSGQVDWIEAPAPDALDAIKARGYKIYSNLQPHLWPWQFSLLPQSPFHDKRVRQAANLCVNRDELKTLLSGQMEPATGVVEPGDPWRGSPSFQVRYDVAAAQKLMADAGYSADHPGQDQGADLRLGFRPDAAVADERVHPGKPQAVLLRRAVRRAGMEHPLFELAPGCQGPGGARRGRDQRQRGDHGSLLRHGALRQQQGLAAGLQQLGLLHQRADRPTHRQGPHVLR
ncbi:peptide/nickel transport system substrate-binding protein [Pseudomonas psychrotolerans]|nr:peptide/nickel transport system substrate-binding protein [Pseudomonas psychrotolerans]